jgi:hypothetical protein
VNHDAFFEVETAAFIIALHLRRIDILPTHLDLLTQLSGFTFF